jgi:RNA polymerase sigma-70 factor, ECF subfamily
MTTLVASGRLRPILEDRRLAALVVAGRIIARFRSGGDEALADAMAEHSPRLRQIVELRIDPRLSGRLDAADVLQEAFLEARKRLSRYLDDPSVLPFVWLRGVVLDTLIDFHRRHLGAKMRDAGQEVSLQGPVVPQASSAALAAYLAGSMTSPSQAAIREETTRQIETVLAGMGEIDREVLILRHFEQLTNDEVAVIVGVKKAAASRRYMRALARFRTVLLTIPGFEQ